MTRNIIKKVREVLLWSVISRSADLTKGGDNTIRRTRPNDDGLIRTIMQSEG